MRLRIQVRSYDAMCKMISANLGIGVMPIQACSAQLQAMDLAAIKIKDSWSVRNLLLATNAGSALSPSSALLVEFLNENCQPKRK